jgi:GNAT superfamily N-acetyltransferase
MTIPGVPDCTPEASVAGVDTIRYNAEVRYVVLGTAVFAAVLGAPRGVPAQVVELTEGDGTVHLTNALTDPRYQRLGILRALPSPGPGVASEAPSSTIRSAALDSHIRQAAHRYGVSEQLVTAVIRVESGFNPRAVSPKGARGLMQLMPATASQLGVRDSFDPVENIDGGVRYLRGLMERFENNLPLALAAYNAGEGAVALHGGIPPYRETQQYVTRILRIVGGDTVLSPAPAGPSALEPGQTPTYIYAAEDGATVYTNIPRRPR